MLKWGPLRQRWVSSVLLLLMLHKEMAYLPSTSSNTQFAVFARTVTSIKVPFRTTSMRQGAEPLPCKDVRGRTIPTVP